VRPAPALGAELGLPRLHLRLEYEGPTGTVKDRIAPALALAAAASGARAVSVGTCGNLGVALAFACRRHGFGCCVFVPDGYSGTRADEMAALGAQVVPVPGAYEDAVEASRRFAEAEGAFEASPGGPSNAAAIGAYATMAEDVLGADEATASVWLPVGNGTVVAGLRAGLARRDGPPALCVVGSAGNTALTAGVAAGRVVELDPEALHETPVNEPLVNWRSLHAEEALAAVTETRGFGHDATDDELVAAQRLLARLEGVPATAAAAAGVAGLAALGRERLDPAARHVAVVTACLPQAEREPPAAVRR
jgi:threonine synthase